MGDYLKTGSINYDLEIFKKKPEKKLSFDKQNLYLQGYGRQWGEKLVYSVGLAYGSGLLLGGSCGLIKGIMKGGKTRKLFLNSVLNSTSVIGPSVANQMASLTMIYYALNNIVKLFTKNEEVYNSTISGFLAGCIYKSSANYKILGSYSILSSAIFSFIDYGFKKGYI
ncbi:mitochondrial import inner membrane translocase subunit TIM23, putative [Plasmodium gallinaceum]|uniref:Mitochondrial import inner membrane translocase subunit TIM23, putative n=1 Tax=Plasmodium gallinaceum TaxID=5849 RepID=A0A1J1GNF7_PLAGA|nr:mitochondrial import inner membrane translocase subunit TIM23, putative [Plasmodium gallinaceum]CRG93917.1 mitochondrial import inner membrane translocase subunit TIM23, putative [Plasmodium gallinaceum]